MTQYNAFNTPSRQMRQLSISADIFVYICHSKRETDAADTHLQIDKAVHAYRSEYQSCLTLFYSTPHVDI